MSVAETKDTMFGLLRRTGPASAELFDTESGAVYGFNFAAFAEMQIGSMQNGREITDDLFFPAPSNQEQGGGDR
jgi:hypothetical protein